MSQIERPDERKYLSDEEIKCLQQNRNIAQVTKDVVKFTEEFKKRFYQEWKQGKTARQLFRENGIDPDVLGPRRVDGFCYRLNKQAKRKEGFGDQRKKNYRRPPKAGDETVEARIRRLEHELAYTRQEVEFLKKLQEADMEARREWESKHRPK